MFEGHRTDYNFTASYKFTSDINAYFSTGTGYKGGGVNPRPFYQDQARSFDPETVTSNELGVKSYFFEPAGCV